MQLKTILNHVSKFKSFVFQTPYWEESHDGECVIVIPIKARANSRAVCSCCGKRRPTYDHLDERRFEFVPLWMIAVFFVYRMRRVDCSTCGVKVESVPWAEGKHTQTITYRWFLAKWAKRLSWAEVAVTFRTSWDSVFRAVEHAVEWGLAHRSLDNVTAIGVDEIQRRKGHRYVTLVYQINEGQKRLLWIGKDRTEQTLRAFFDMFGEQRSAALEFVCSDMWQAYLKVIKEKAAGAINILDRFHIMQKMNKAIDQIRRAEIKAITKEHEHYEVLKGAKWSLLKRRENLTDKQTVKLQELLKCNLKAVRGYLLREDFQRFWHYQLPYWAGRFLDEWCTRTMRSQLEPMKNVAKSLRNHRPLILNWFKARGTMSSGAVEGLNLKAKLAIRKAFGFKSYRTMEIALYHALGDLPEPGITHRFC